MVSWHSQDPGLVDLNLSNSNKKELFTTPHFHGTLYNTPFSWNSLHHPIFMELFTSPDFHGTLYNTPFSSNDSVISILVHLKVQLVANIEPTYIYLCLAIP